MRNIKTFENIEKQENFKKLQKLIRYLDKCGDVEHIYYRLENINDRILNDDDINTNLNKQFEIDYMGVDMIDIIIKAWADDIIKRLSRIQNNNEIILDMSIIDVYNNSYFRKFIIEYDKYIKKEHGIRYDNFMQHNDILLMLLTSLIGHEKVEKTIIQWIDASDDVIDEVDKLDDAGDHISATAIMLNYRQPIITLKLKQ